MTNQELFKQAIADAKSVRDAAVANAKAALEETFTPQIMAMLSNQLNELEEDGNLEEKKEETEEGYYEEGHEAAIGYGAASQKPSIEETDLEEILAQLSEDDDESDSVSEAKEKDEKGKKPVEEAKDKEEDKKKKVEESLDEAEGSDEVTELTVDELKDMIRDVMADVMGGESKEEEPSEDEDEAKKDDEGEDLELNELLADLMAEAKKEKEEKAKDKKKVEESSMSEAFDPASILDLLQNAWEAIKDRPELAAPLATAGVFAAIKKVADAEKKANPDSNTADQVGRSMGGNMVEAKKDLLEAIKTINVLRDELNEVNLLNAKLLYTNKIFKAKSLSESQKVNVLKAFDRATSVKETKTIYAALTESLNTKTKSTIKESVGFASKAAGVAPKQPIVEGDSAIRRMQQLAGIIK